VRSRWRPQLEARGGIRAAFASLLDIAVEEVPEVPSERDDLFKHFGLKCIALPGTQEPGVYHVAVGPSNNGPGMHAVVKYGKDIVHDPAPSGDGLIECFAIYVLVPIDVARIKYDE